MLNIALPKGRLGDRVYDLFARLGYPCDLYHDPGRKLVVENPQAGVRYFLVKPWDVAIYVERGVADLGVVGKDILLEQHNDVYELLDLGFGKCRMAVCAPTGYREDRGAVLRVATKFPGITKQYYAGQNRTTEVIKLNGSIELAPILGLSDVIVDLVETGGTLRENNLEVLTEILPISARLIANKAAYQFQYETIQTILTQMGELLS